MDSNIYTNLKKAYIDIKNVDKIKKMTQQNGGVFELLKCKNNGKITDIDNFNECFTEMKIKLDDNQIIIDGTKLKKIGEGAYAKVYHITDMNLVLRIEKFKDEQTKKNWEFTSNCQHSFATLGISPDIMTTWTCNPKNCMEGDQSCEFGYGFQLMSKLKYSLDDIIKNNEDINKYIPRMIEILRTIMESKYEHCDWHLNNWMIDENDNIFIIDLGNMRSWTELLENKETTGSSCLLPSIKAAYSIYVNCVDKSNETAWLNFCNEYFNNFLNKMDSTIKSQYSTIINILVNAYYLSKVREITDHATKIKRAIEINKNQKIVKDKINEMKNPSITDIFVSLYSEFK